MKSDFVGDQIYLNQIFSFHNTIVGMLIGGNELCMIVSRTGEKTHKILILDFIDEGRRMN